MTILSNGNVGIGTTEPGEKFTVNGNIEILNNELLIKSSIDTTGTHPVLNVQNSRGTISSPTYLLKGDEVGAIAFREGVTTGVGAGGAGISFFASENWSPTALGSNIKFFTTPNGSVTKTTYLSVSDAGVASFGDGVNIRGNVGIGTTTPDAQLEIMSASAGNNLKLSNLTGTTLLNAVVTENIGVSFDVMDGATSRYLVLNQSGGEVGIGTASPTSPLQISHSGANLTALTLGDQDTPSSDTGIYIRTTGIGLISTASGGDLQINPGGSGAIGTGNGVRIKNSGNVGIGTTTPTGKLQLASAANTRLTLSDTNAGLDAQHWFVNSDSGNFSIGTTSDSLLTDNKYLTIKGSTGNVGIGTTGPGQSLSIGVAAGKIGFARGSGGENGTLGFKDTSGNDRYVLELNNTSGSGEVRINQSSVSSPVGITFYTSGSEQMRINSSGNVGIGTTTPYALLSISNSKTTAANTPLFSIASTTGGTATTTVFSVASTGDVTVNGSSGSTCVIGNSTGATMCSSDEQLKTNITVIPDALESIEQIKGVTFNWADTTKNQNQFIGVIAQDVQKVFPQAVATLSDGYLAVDYGALVAPLIEAVKEIGNISGEFKSNLIAWLGNATNGIADLFATNGHFSNELCVGGTCITGSQLQQLLQASGQQASAPSIVEPIVDSTPPPETDTASSTDPIVTDDTQATTPTSLSADEELRGASTTPDIATSTDSTNQ
ncbi:MAG: tail fiber domain-containing protein [Candidatus Paceibacterota bacterium]|jgi:hypothetical protein